MSTFETMKHTRAIKNISAVIAVIAGFLVIDYCFGVIIEMVQTRAKGGDTKNLYYINNLSQDSILIMGSSRASHHYVPDTLSKTLEMPAYNCGVDGNGIILAYGFLNNIINNGGRPRMIIYDFFPPFDVYDNNDCTNAINLLKPFYDRPGVKEIIDDISPDEYVKYNLATYRYNSIFIQILSDAVIPLQHTRKGYKPLTGEIGSEFVQKEENSSAGIDSIKVKYFTKFIELTDKYNIDIVFVTSPSFYPVKDAERHQRLLAGVTPNRKYLYFNFLNNPEFTGHKELFVDPSHMNQIGAEKFSKALLDSIAAHKSMIKN